ncbi:MAG: type III pantothenate kinase [Candidatus Obscuribacterales bacterium]|nr:type III pantothenate kinase [Candidatus Obscuribacterales bacterium]
MKIYAVDLGNSEIKRALIEDGKISEIKRSPTADLDNLLDEISSQDAPVALSCVRKSGGEKIKVALANKNKELIVDINSKTASPVTGFYDGIGADRIADISAAWTDYGSKRPVAVIGLGTASTITASSTAGIFKGGFITLGLGSVCATLTSALPDLPAIDPRQARSLEPGFEVYASICRGTVAAHVGIVEEWISIFRRDLGEDLYVIATGGWCELIAGYCPSIQKVDPLLTLKGIWTVAAPKLRSGG